MNNLDAKTDPPHSNVHELFILKLYGSFPRGDIFEESVIDFEKVDIVNQVEKS